MLALTLMMPLQTLYANLMGILGGALIEMVKRKNEEVLGSAGKA
jgi:ABC-type transporter Mla maintaining outer membrane lipid asymmetry permease subunit MlaE